MDLGASSSGTTMPAGGRVGISTMWGGLCGLYVDLRGKSFRRWTKGLFPAGDEARVVGGPERQAADIPEARGGEHVPDLRVRVGAPLGGPQ